MARKPKLTEYEMYLQSGSWRCDESPTGAHHWVEHDRIWVCKYCFDARKWPMTFAEAMAIQHPGTAYPITLVDNKAGLHDRNLVPRKKTGRIMKW